MLALDIQAFNDHRRGDDAQGFLRAAMYALLVRAFARSDLDWSVCHHEDRGDGVLVIAPSEAPPTALIDPLVDYLRVGLRGYNKLCDDLARIDLRVSAHAGQVYFDDNGVYGRAVSHLFRMLNADDFKRALAASGSDFALVTSDTMYADVISRGPGLIDPDMYAPIDIECKETHARAWLYLPPVPNPFLEPNHSRGRHRRRIPERKAAPNGLRHPAGPTALVPCGDLPISFPDPRESQPQHPLERGADKTGEAPSTRGSIPDRARLIAANAVTRSRQLAAVPRSSFVHARVRELRYPRQRVQHV